MSDVLEDNAHAERIAVAFSRVLRSAGITTPIGNVLTFVEALGKVGINDRDNVYWAGRPTLLRRPEDIALYNKAFAVFWERRVSNVAEPDEQLIRLTIEIDDETEGADDGSSQDADDDGESITIRFSSVETLRTKDFATYSDDELHLAQDLMSKLRLVGSPRNSFRMRSTAKGSRPDLRQTVRSSLRSGGEPIRRHWQENDERLRRLILLLDVSGSMEPYARALLRFVQAAVAGRQKVEAFAIGTRLTRVTRELGSRDPDKALKLAADRVVDWSGGTRLGECIRNFNDEWGVRGMARGAIVVVLSDGWDRGEPEVLAEQMRRLQRVSFRTIWVNPLKVTPGYAPLARGMAAAMPYIDRFVEGHSVDAMEQLTLEIAGR
jgi:uncharacterized protein with von Willebrand factor type A (vWA) domain